MRDDVPTYRTSLVRRGTGVLIATVPFAVIALSLLRAATEGSRASTTGFVVVAVGAALAAFNFYLSFVRRLIAPNRATVSVVPMIATMVVLVGTLTGFGSTRCAVLGLFSTVLDTGGPAWFLLATWKDKSFWDTPSSHSA